LAPACRLPLLWLDWSGARVASVVVVADTNVLSDGREFDYEEARPTTTCAHPRWFAFPKIVRACPIVALPGYSRPLIRVADFNQLLTESTYTGGQVRP
jgi:hypothetical protein